MSTIGQRIKIRRLALSLTQKDAAERSGVAYRTWRRMEGEGKASIEDMVRAARRAWQHYFPSQLPAIWMNCSSVSALRLPPGASGWEGRERETRSRNPARIAAQD
jgi:DNA-binding XRE family transcriptional regulator